MALEAPDNFFFGPMAGEMFAVAPFTSIETFMQLPEEIFGSPPDWLPFTGMSRAARSTCVSEDDVELADLLCGSDEDGDESAQSVVIPEIGHMPSLRDYEDKSIDRRPSLLRNFIDDLADSTPIGGGWFTMDASHHQKYGIPGRHIPSARSSLAKLTREARTVAVSGKCSEFDQPFSHTKILVRLLQENSLCGEFKMLILYATHYTRWRELWGKRPLTRIGYGGAADGEAWNPITWTLSAEIRRAAVALLALPQYSYLTHMCCQRRNPLFTCLYYALTPVEAEDLLKARLDFDLHGFIVRGLLYDSILAEGSEEELVRAHGLVEKTLQRWQDRLFMVLRSESEKGVGLVQKVPECKRMCIFNS